MRLFHGSNMEIDKWICQGVCQIKILDADFSSMECNLDCKYDVVIGPVANDTVGLLIRQFSRGTIDAEYLRKEFDFGRLTNQYTFHTEKALRYLKKVGVMHDKSAAGND